MNVGQTIVLIFLGAAAFFAMLAAFAQYMVEQKAGREIAFFGVLLLLIYLVANL